MIVAGFGFRAGASDESIRDALAGAATDHAPQVLATADDKIDGLRAVAKAMNLPIVPVTETDLIGLTSAIQVQVGSISFQTPDNVLWDRFMVPGQFELPRNSN